jgi:hypothetical protein
LSFVISLAAGCTQGLLMIVNFFYTLMHTLWAYAHSKFHLTQPIRVCSRKIQEAAARTAAHQGQLPWLLPENWQAHGDPRHLKALTANTLYRLSASQSDFQPLLA